jgi:hypothetical protein
MVCRRSQIRKVRPCRVRVAPIGVGEHGFTSVDESASAATLRRVRVQKVTPAAAHPAHGFDPMGPDLPVCHSLAECLPGRFTSSCFQISPWLLARKAGMAAVVTPWSPTHTASPNAPTFVRRTPDVVVPAGPDEYLVCCTTRRPIRARR